MKTNSTKQSAFHGTGGDDRRNLRRTDYARRIFCIRRSADPLFGSADNSARNHTCGNSPEYF